MGVIAISSTVYVILEKLDTKPKSIKRKELQEPKTMNYRLSYEGNQLEFAQREIDALQQENKELRQENDLLKKLNNPYNGLKNRSEKLPDSFDEEDQTPKFGLRPIPRFSSGKKVD